MIDQKSLRRVPTLVGALQRPRYAAGSSLAAHDLRTEQRYRLQRLRRHHRYLHGWGVICGLLVVPAGDPRRPWAVQVCPGVCHWSLCGRDRGANTRPGGRA